MRICVFEDRGVLWLDPLTLTRPAFDLLCGTGSLLQRQRRYFGAEDVGVLVRPPLVELCRATHPDLAVNDPAWFRSGTKILVNARWLAPAEPAVDIRTPHAAVLGDQIAYVVLPGFGVTEWLSESLDGWLQGWKQTLPCRPARGTMIDYAWDLVTHNAEALCQDWQYRDVRPSDSRPLPPLAVVGPEGKVVVAEDVHIDPFVVVDTTQGPVFIERGAVVHSFSRLEGPCYIGPESWILGAKIRGGTIGPVCRVGGEFECSILQGYSNKYHDGFLGHSYIGEWVNLAAGTQVSDLRNDYSPITMTVVGDRIATGQSKLGSFIGDHTRTGLNTLLNTGSVFGAFCQLLPTGTYLPRSVPSFCSVGHGHLEEQTDLRQLFATAATVMRRRGRELTTVQTDFYYTLYDQTIAPRRQAIRASEQRRMRRSM